MKKFLSLILAAVMITACFTACNKEEGGEVSESSYNGILTKVKLGMPLSKIVSLQPDNVNLYYESDTTIWSVNTDTELMEITSLIPADKEQHFYVEDSIITYNFRTVKGDEEIYLNDYISEVQCRLERKTAEEYFYAKTDELAAKHKVEPISVKTGTEGIDLDVTYMQKFDYPSYTFIFTMKETYDTIEGVDGYYGSYFSMEVKEKEVKTEVPIDETK
ncbi:MAG: hypothetical protein J1F11_11430 [Oscillospiraceae bacterium]|nr:hypothetical protein [Oscillospiraceae bacterium]